MAQAVITVDLDLMVNAVCDRRTPHYWDTKRHKILRGTSGSDEVKARRVLIETLGRKQFKRLVDGFAVLLDSKDAKLVLDAVKVSFDKFNRLLLKDPELKQQWLRYAGSELTEAVIEWLADQGIEEFFPTGELARYAFGNLDPNYEEEE